MPVHSPVRISMSLHIALSYQDFDWLPSLALLSTSSASSLSIRLDISSTEQIIRAVHFYGSIPGSLLAKISDETLANLLDTVLRSSSTAAITSGRASSDSCLRVSTVPMYLNSVSPPNWVCGRGPTHIALPRLGIGVVGVHVGSPFRNGWKQLQ